MGGVAPGGARRPVFRRTAAIRAAGAPTRVCGAPSPPSTAANVSVTLLIAAACAAAWPASAAVRLALTDCCKEMKARRASGGLGVRGGSGGGGLGVGGGGGLGGLKHIGPAELG